MFKRNAIINFIIFISLPAIALLAFVAFKIMLIVSCQNKVLQTYNSPDLRWKVVVFVRDCGPITPTEIHGALLSYDEPFKDNKSNIFILETKRGDISSKSLGNSVEIKWKDSRNLSVIYQEEMSFYIENPSLKSIEISYQTKPKNLKTR